MNIASALNDVFAPVRDDVFNDLMAKLDETKAAAQEVIEKTTQLDGDLCLNCGPNRFKLRQKYARQSTSRSASKPRASS